jgi:hypothetical protein
MSSLNLFAEAVTADFAAAETAQFLEFNGQNWPLKNLSIKKEIACESLMSNFMDLVKKQVEISIDDIAIALSGELLQLASVVLTAYDDKYTVDFISDLEIESGLYQLLLVVITQLNKQKLGKFLLAKLSLAAPPQRLEN